MEDDDEDNADEDRFVGLETISSGSPSTDLSDLLVAVALVNHPSIGPVFFWI